MSNATRGQLAEFIVGSALGIDLSGVRNERDPYDLTIDGIKIEVKASGYLQSWNQKKESTISWSIRPTSSWNERANRYEGEPRRQADVYVLALLTHLDKTTADPLDVSQWCFYVVPTALLDAPAWTRRKSISLPSVRRFVGEPTSYSELPHAVKSGPRSR